jgi:cytosine/adenosine deaminase-related metal-dependent hydrolase
LTAPAPLVLRNARLAGSAERRDIALADGRVAGVAGEGQIPPCPREVDLAGRVVLPGLVNAHDHLDASTLPSLAGPRCANARQWAAALESRQGEAEVMAAVAVPLPDRLFLGGLRNLLAGVTAVAHHGAFHRSLARAEFPVRVLERYQFAPAASTSALRRTYRTTDRRIPWFVHAGEGTDEEAGGDVARLASENLLRQNTVMIHAIALPASTLTAVAAARACVVWSPEANRNVYGATADVRALIAAGVRVGLGAESPVCGVRDLLSTLAAARREAAMSDGDLLALATAASAEVARLPAGGLETGALADLVAVDSVERLLEGERAAIVLVVVGGEPRYGADAVMGTLEPRGVAATVDGERRRLAPAVGARAASLWRRHRAAGAAGWMKGVSFGEAAA